MALLGRESAQEKERAERYARWLQSQNVFAIASCVLGIFSLIEFGALVIFGVGGIVAGAVALRQLKTVAADQPRTRGHLLAWIGITTSIVSLILACLIYLRIFG